MKRLIVFLLGVSLCMAAQSNPVTEAKAQLEKKHHEALVNKAERFLKEKAKLEARLKTVEDKLQKLENGQDVKDDASPEDADTNVVSPTGTICTMCTTGYIYCCQSCRC